MGEKEKAKQLFDKFWDYNRDNELESVVNTPHWHCVNLAIICVEEIILACEYNDVETHNTDWWKRVIIELEKI
jgi:hypothetical protein